MPIVWNMPAGRRHHWRYIVIDVRLGRQNFKGVTGHSDGSIVLLTRRCVGPVAFSYMRSIKV